MRQTVIFIWKVAALALILVLVLGIATPKKSVYAQTPRRFFVAPTAVGAGDCSSWSNACTLSTAMSVGNRTIDEFWLKAGRYVTSECLHSIGGYYGGFAGWETSLSQRDLRNNLTIVTGDQDNNDITNSQGIVMDYADIRGTNLSRSCTVGDRTGVNFYVDGIVFTGFSGGTIFNILKGNHFIRNVVFSGNSSIVLTIVYQSDSTSITVENSVFRGNIAGMHSPMSNKPTTVRNSLFINNYNSDSNLLAAGISYKSSPLITIENSTFINNRSYVTASPGTAGAVVVSAIAYKNNWMPTVRNNTFTNNVGSRVGGFWLSFALYTQPPYSNPVFQNNIFADNTALGGISGISDYYPDAWVYGGASNYRNNLIKNVGSCTGCYPSQYGNITGVDPNLGPLQNNGGVTNTREPLPGSPAIDAGYDTGITPDARGVSRPQDGNLDGTAVYDIGAVEYVPDTTPPQVSSITRVGGSPTKADTVQFLVTFSETVTGVDPNDFAVTSEGVSGASVLSVTGSGSTRTVTVSTGSGDGWIRLDIPASATINDSAGNPLSNKPFTGGESYVIDRTQPLVVSVTRLDPQRTGLAYIRFRVVFSEPVIGLTPGDFELVTTGTIVDAAITGISGSGDTYIITVFTGYGNGTIRLDVK